MIRALVAVAWSTAVTPSGWRWRRPASCCRTWRPSWAGNPAITPRRCTRATPSTASCTSNPPSRPAAAAYWDCGRWSTRTATREMSHAKSWTGVSPRCSSEDRAVSATSEWATVLVEARRVATDIAGLLGVEVDAATILTGRAAIMNLARPGRISAGGATRLLRTVDGWCAVALPRDDDVAALPALIEVDAPIDDPWVALSRWAAAHSTDEVVDRARLLDIAVAALGEAAAEPPTVQPCGTSTGPRQVGGLLVVDMSSLWAGPLCGQLLARA